MPLYLLFGFFLLFSFCAPADALAPGSSRVELFKRQNSTVPFEENGKVTERVVHSFRLPALVNVDGVMVAIADARYDTSNDNSLIDTVAKYSVDGGETWETQIAIKNSRVSSFSRVVDPTVIVKGNKLYVLVGSYNISTNYWMWHGDASDWDILLAVGEVTKSTVDGNTTVSIKWGSPVPVKEFFPREMEGVPTKQFLGGAGVATLASNGNLVYPVQVTNVKGQIFSKIFYSEDDGKTWKFGKGRSAFGCSEPVALEWEGKLIINTRVDRARRLVYESSDMGNTWVEAVGTLSRVWGPSPKSDQPGSQSSFTAVTIEGMRVMLFTHPLNFKGKWLRDRLNLWLTDNQRIYNVGQVSIGDENAAYSSVLYMDDKLYCLHEINTDEVYSLVFARLVGELMIIKSVLQSWKTWDSYLSSICTPADPAASSSKRGCGPPFPTAGLVGFLSHSASQNVWEDAYRCVNASINHGTNLTRGFKFEGRNAGALWPVGKQGQNQRYRFANHRFTLVALVSIHKVPRSTRPLVGASLDGSGYRKLLGLSYDKEQRWVPTFGRAASSPTGSWELNKTYHVVLAFEEGVGYIYVDGEPLRGSGQRLTSVQLKSMEISHFSIGSYGTSDRGTDSQITVTHVLLYNRRIEPSEVQTLFLGISKIVATSESMANEMVIQKMMLDASERGSIFSRIDTLFLLTLLLLLSIS
ncbi:putative trans-sialidase, Group I [Trypanosoma cruzi]|uniref:Trans-sialidase, putative n=2 Tax=Trypanosoma cruzi TaxID=5693 RepID=Q4CWF1_TRYCC|nr:trans-sialidase, putative [Trypanosoma cruzi]EAN84603.1 trans-sialidase, putative [Trypanosoma cruzi]PWV19508.1 putative trans-sialidase, Group I [Trypanosoma cruzi]RNC59372.1 sialidase [Trypanosoma cruzi]|eukprot:XP_806454.1 trans-sialidase [Trypanosoma cruzi strain CL Brener]